MSAPIRTVKKNTIEVSSFVHHNTPENIDWETVKSFGEEWSKFSSFSDEEIKGAGDQYFDVVDEKIFAGAEVLDVGCGTGRWTKYVCDKVGFVEAIDPSDAVFAAVSLLKEKKNVRVTQASVDHIPFEDNAFDLVFSLGVLHHIPDTFDGIKKCVAKVKPGGYFLIYLYYNMDNRGILFKMVFVLSNLLRRVICKLPSGLKKSVCDFLSVVVYMPLVLFSRLLERFSFSRSLVKYTPLSYYRDKSFNIIRNDSLDRFGTPLEKRFSKSEIETMLVKAGLKDIVFSNNEPYWHAIGKKA